MSELVASSLPFSLSTCRPYAPNTFLSSSQPECFKDGRGRGYDDSVPGEVTKTIPSEDRAP